MNNILRKGDYFLCRKDVIHQPGVTLFKKGDIYRCKSNGYLTDLQGNSRIGWNQDVFNRHFRQIPKPDTFLDKVLMTVMILGALVGLILMFFWR